MQTRKLLANLLFYVETLLKILFNIFLLENPNKLLKPHMYLFRYLIQRMLQLR